LVTQATIDGHAVAASIASGVITFGTTIRIKEGSTLTVTLSSASVALSIGEGGGLRLRTSKAIAAGFDTGEEADKYVTATAPAVRRAHTWMECVKLLVIGLLLFVLGLTVGRRMEIGW
jgi:hypothetical protein